MSGPRGVDGFIGVNKPIGARSTDVVGVARRALGVRRVGHCGTLDPLAAGVVPIAVGRATRLSEYVLGATKTYVAAVLFGIRTATDDLEGTVVGSVRPEPEIERVLHVLPHFVGAIRQRPPATSAVRMDGRRAYERVRAGEDVTPAERDVQIYSIDPVATASARIGVRDGNLLVGGTSASTHSLVVAIEVRCGSGTYIRSLARDLGEAVGSGATLLALVRTAVGPFTLMESVGLEELEHAAAGQAAASLYAPDVILEDWPACVISVADRDDFVHGRPLSVEPGGVGLHRFYDSCGEFLGLAESLGKAWGKRRVMLSST